MTRSDDALLVAYVDGELDMVEARDVEQLLERDPVARQKVRIFRETGALLRAACGESAYADVPEALRKCLLEVQPIPRRVYRFALPLAASIALAAIFSGGYFAGTVTSQPAAGARAATLDDIASYHLVYARETKHLVEIPADRRDELAHWLGERLNRSLLIPDLSDKGYSFEGGRLLVADGKPVAQLMYTRPNADPLAVCVTFGEDKDPSLRLEHRYGLEMASWQDHGYTYVVIGTVPTDTLRTLTADVASQFQKG
jgi:anti-sigma factor RsiW